MEHLGSLAIETVAAAILHQLGESIEVNEEIAIGKRGCARNDAVVIPRITLRHHQRLASAVGATVAIRARRTATVKGSQDFLADHGRDVTGAEAVVDLGRWVMPSPLRARVAVTAVVTDKCVASRQHGRAAQPELVVARGRHDRARLPAAADDQHLAVPVSQRELDSEPYIRPDDAFDDASARRLARAFDSVRSRDLRRRVLRQREIREPQLHALLACFFGMSLRRRQQQQADRCAYSGSHCRSAMSPSASVPRQFT